MKSLDSTSRERLYLTTLTSKRSRNASRNCTDFMINKKDGEGITELKKDEMNLKKSIKIIQNKNKEYLKSFHKNTLVESLKTTQMTTTTLWTDYHVAKTDMEGNLTTGLPINKNFFYKNISCMYKEQECLTDFTNKTRSLAKMRYCLDIEKGRRDQLREDNFLLEDEQKENIRDYMNYYKLFEDFLGYMNRYKRSLEVKKEVEQINLNDFREDLGKIKKEISMLQFKRDKNTERLNLLKEYKKFLITLKAETLSKETHSYFRTISQTSNSRPNQSIKKSTKNIVMPNVNLRDAARIQRSTCVKGKNMMNLFNNLMAKNSKEKNQKTEEDEDEEEINIYANSEEVLNDFQVLQNKLMEQVKVYNENNETLKKLLNLPDNTTEDPTELSMLESKLKRLKEEHVLLNNEKIKLEKQKDTNQINQKVFIKIKEIFDYLNHLKLFTISALPKFQQENFSQNGETIFKLKKIEEIMIYLKSRYDMYSADPDRKKEMNILEKNMDKDRKSYLKKLKEEFMEMKNKQMIKRMHEKHQRIVIITGRKFGPRFKKDTDKKEVETIVEDNQESEFNEFISF